MTPEHDLIDYALKGWPCDTQRFLQRADWFLRLVDGQIERAIMAERERTANEIVTLRSALRFYADPSKYEPLEITTLKIGFIHGEIHDRDRGDIARRALSQGKAALEGTER